MRKRLIIPFVGLSALMAWAPLCAYAQNAVQPSTVPFESIGVVPGIDVLQERNFDLLKGKRIGLVTNPTGCNLAGETTIDVLRRAPGVQLVALYGPEHGLRGNAKAGAKVTNARDSVTGLPIYSLYGKTRQPTSAMLRGIQVLVFDMQDIGTRSYTFLATLEKCRQACAANKVALVVLDRPNPLGGGIEGNIPGEFSFVCPAPMPYRYGLTLGEIAGWLNARAAKKCPLTVVPMRNYTRQPFAQTGLSWVPSSPNIPRPASAFFYEATGLLGELPALSIGIGTPWPFELAGAPGLDGRALAARLNVRRLPGWKFQPVSWVPKGGRHIHKRCEGVQIQLTDARVAQPTRLNFEIFAAVKQVAPKMVFFPKNKQSGMFDKICGTSQIRLAMMHGQSADSLWTLWNRGSYAFQKDVARFRIYG